MGASSDGVLTQSVASLRFLCGDDGRRTMIFSAFNNLNDFIPALESARDPDLILGNAEMLCQQSDRCIVGSAFLGWLFDFDHKVISILSNFF